MASSADALEGVNRSVQVALDESFIADDFVHVRIVGQDQGIEPGAAELAKNAVTIALMIVAHGGEQRVAGTFSFGLAPISVIVDPRFAAFVAQDSADAPARRRDLIDEDALADGLRVVFLKQSVEHHGEFVETGGAIEYGVDDVA